VALRVFGWICRLSLGVLFLIAGYTKLRNPFLFEMAVDAYRLLPPWAVVVVARGLPWFEVLLGILLLVGWKLRYFASLAALLLGVFVTMMAITYSRGVEANCGCFGFGEKISPTTLARDSALLALAVFLAAYSWRTALKSRASIQDPESEPRLSKSGNALP
jgi:uncharacterized membrane protein YphA (DoxX/SURF4 family)